MEKWGKTKGGQAYKKRNNKKITGLKMERKNKNRTNSHHRNTNEYEYVVDQMDINDKSLLPEEKRMLKRALHHTHNNSKLTKIKNDLEMDNIRQMVVEGKLKEGDMTKKGKIVMIGHAPNAGGFHTIAFARKTNGETNGGVTFASGIDVEKEERQLASSFKSTTPKSTGGVKGVRKNSRIGLKPWYGHTVWKAGDRFPSTLRKLTDGGDMVWLMNSSSEGKHIRMSQRDAEARVKQLGL